MLKFAYFINSTWRAAAILEIENLQYLRNRSTDRDEILSKQANVCYNPCGMLKYAYIDDDNDYMPMTDVHVNGISFWWQFSRSKIASTRNKHGR